jgi:hypothetical protein
MITIIQDTREKVGTWDFTFYGVNQTVQGLKTGDYSVLGYEDVFAIERKKTSGEIATNLGTKREPFLREMERMSKLDYRYIICEFPESYLDEFPKNSGIPKRFLSKIRMTGHILKSSINMIKSKYGINFIFTSGKDEAEHVALQLFSGLVSGVLPKANDEFF